MNVLGTASYAILYGIRTGKTFAQIREDMKWDVRYRFGNQNQWIFPDERAYQESVRRRLGMAIQERTRQILRNGKPFVIDKAH